MAVAMRAMSLLLTSVLRKESTQAPGAKLLQQLKLSRKQQSILQQQRFRNKQYTSEHIMNTAMSLFLS
jgi:hypothetical protein